MLSQHFPRFFALLALILCVTISSAQDSTMAGDPMMNEPAPPTIPPPGENDHQELRNMLTLVTVAVNEGDFDRLGPLLHEDFVMTMIDQSVLTNMDQIKSYSYELLKSDSSLLTKLTVDPTATIKTIFTDNTNGYCYGTSKDKYEVRGGVELEMESKWTAHVKKVNGKWLLVSVHVGSNVADNPLLNAARSMQKWYAIGAGLVGLILGWLIGRMFGGKKKKAA